MEGHLLRGENGFLAECQMQITERVGGYVDGRTGEFHSYQELQQYNPNMKARSRTFRTSGIVLCIESDWFKRGGVKTVVSDKLREVFTHEYSVLPQDVGSAASNIVVRDGDGRTWRGGCVALFDQTYGSLRLTERLYLEFNHILQRLSVAARADSEIDGSIIEQIREEVSGFASQSPFATEPGEQRPSGYMHVFSKGYLVNYREQGFIATEVEIIQPTIMDGGLKYQVKAQQKPWEPPLRRWISESSVEPTGDADAWEYVWWNPETETYEDPFDDDV